MEKLPYATTEPEQISSKETQHAKLGFDDPVSGKQISVCNGFRDKPKYKSGTFFGGCIRHCLCVWKTITSDPWVLEHIQGVYPNLIMKPIQFSYQKEIKWSESELVSIDEEVRSLLDKDVVHKVKFECSDQFISNIFLRKKANGSNRVILNLKHFNDFVVHTHFKMDTLKDAIFLVKRGCFFSTIDLQDAYYSVPL